MLVLSVVNGLDNALKYSEGAPVEVRVEAAGDVATITIDDAGPGVARDDRERVFEPFQRATGERDSRIRGHGIGLALVAHVMSVHGGTAGFEERERGARLLLELPLSRTSNA